MTVAMAMGCSTNAIIHLIAMARAAGVILDTEDFDELSAATPLMAKVYPNGLADVNHFHAAGGLGYTIRTLLEVRGGQFLGALDHAEARDSVQSPQKDVDRIAEDTLSGGLMPIRGLTDSELANIEAARETRSTLTGLVHRTGDLLQPIYEAQWVSVLAGDVVAMDETPIKAGRKVRGKMKTGYFWPIYGDRDETVFPFSASRSGQMLDEALEESAVYPIVRLDDLPTEACEACEPFR